MGRLQSQGDQHFGRDMIGEEEVGLSKDELAWSLSPQSQEPLSGLETGGSWLGTWRAAGVGEGA